MVSYAATPIPTSYGYTKLPRAKIAVIILCSLLILVLIAVGILMLGKKKRGRTRKRHTVIEIAGTPVPRKHDEDAHSELPARLMRQGF